MPKVTLKFIDVEAVFEGSDPIEQLAQLAAGYLDILIKDRLNYEAALDVEEDGALGEMPEATKLSPTAQQVQPQILQEMYR